MTNALNAMWKHVDELHDLAMAKPDVAGSGGLSLSKFLQRLHEPALDPIRETLSLYPRQKRVLARMDRWLVIEYPKRLADLTGSFGTSIRTSDALRLAAEVQTEQSPYYTRVADRLDLTPALRPVVSDPMAAYRRTLDSWICLADLMGVHAAELSRDALLQAHSSASFHLSELARGGSAFVFTEIDYPCDLLPTENKEGRVSQGLAMNTGQLMRYLYERADYVSADEREELKLALQFYPDPELELEIRTERGESLLICSPYLLDSGPNPAEIGPAVGSVKLDHYGLRSQYSANPGEFEFRLHLPREGDEDDETCILVSDIVAYSAELAI